MKKRNIPFGYQYQNGAITTHPQEAAVLNRIFSEYQNGLSLLEIASRLNDENIEYQPGVTGWNKSRIMRLIEDERYNGKDGFPAIIDEDTHQAMIEMKAQKNTQHSTDRNHEIFHIDVPMICPTCGGEMVRRHDSRFRKCQQRWICSNADCRTIIHKADSDLLDDITVLLNRAIVNPDLVQVPIVDEFMSVQTLKAENEIARTLDTLDYDKNALRKAMLECASLKYEDIDSAPYITHRLKAVLADAGPLSAFSLPLFKRTVQAIHLEKDGAIAITLINNQIIGKEDEDATSSNYPAESSAENTSEDQHL
ncbi:recombinase family protein [Acutalibacter caecimuris]|uniref:recombinase family protein n=1 Tax=Acutalibacter caecimuris TaxID=3093657 RepID=UPI002AC8F4FB|nr:recombinase family protein [Acutalibacter sp. M00118]